MIFPCPWQRRHVDLMWNRPVLMDSYTKDNKESKGKEGWEKEKKVEQGGDRWKRSSDGLSKSTRGKSGLK